MNLCIIIIKREIVNYICDSFINFCSYYLVNYKGYTMFITSILNIIKYILDRISS